MWHSLSIFRTWLLSLLPAKQLWGCLLPIPTCRSSLPDWTPLINCQLDWLQVFIICDDWANLEANLNQGCWETGEHHSSSRLGLKISPGSLPLTSEGILTWCYMWRVLQALVQALAIIRALQSLSRTTKTTKHKFSSSFHDGWPLNCCVFRFWGEFLPHPCLLELPYQGLNRLPLWLVTLCFCSWKGWALSEKRVQDMHITVMTMVW